MRLSYSSINTYETCPAKYRFQYEERLPTASSPALTFGDVLHRALFRFHDRPVPVPPSLEELQGFLDDEWSDEGYRDPGEESLYRDHARQVLADYYRENAGQFRIPAALEFRFTIEVEGVQLSGVIDRMDRIPGGGYEIIDYKTGRRLPPQARIDQDLQLSVYHLAAQGDLGHRAREADALLPAAGPAHDHDPHGGRRRRPSATHRDGRRAHRRREVRATQNPLCDWCDFQARCPLFRHKYDRAGGDPAPNMSAIVDEWIELKRQDWETYRRLEDLKALINSFCEEHGYQRLFGSDGAAIDRRAQHVTAPDADRIRAHPRAARAVGPRAGGGPEAALRPDRVPRPPARRRGRAARVPRGGPHPARPVPEGAGSGPAVRRRA